MKALELKILPVLIFLVAILGIYNSPVQKEIYQHIDAYVPIIAGAIFLLGVLVALLGVITFRRAKTTVNPVSIENASSLVTHGIFKITRNPMYLGMALCIAGVGIYLQTHWIMLALFVMFFVSYITRFQIAPEERILTELFGEQYTKYMSETRRWL